MKPEPVIAKLERPGPGLPLQVILFFPERPARRGYIECWAAVGEHSEADTGYMARCAQAEAEDARIALDLYMRSYPHQPGESYKRVQRDSPRMQAIRWSR